METGSVAVDPRSVAGASAGARAQGFTLLELIVVLALAGLVLTLALPNLEKLYEGFTKRAEQGRILNQIAGLGREAMLRGRAFAVYGTAGDAAKKRVLGFEAYDLAVPAGWELRLDRPLLVRANGVCLGATVTLVEEGTTRARVILEAPFCSVDADA